MSSTNFPNGVKTFPADDVNQIIKTGNATLTNAECISGYPIVVTGDGGVDLTLPDAAAGNAGAVVTVVNKSNGGYVLVTPHSSDFIAYGGAVVINKYVGNGSGSMRKGDYITLIRSVAATDWTVTAVSGVWTKEA